MFTLTSSAFQNNSPIPRTYSGQGDDISPALSWSNVPEGTLELALICDDPDAPTPDPWVHWVIYKIPATTKSLKEALPQTPSLKDPAGALQGTNSWGTVGYRGPMPPPGTGDHHYHFVLYALDKELDLDLRADKKALLKTIQNHVLGTAKLTGTYRR